MQTLIEFLKKESKLKEYNNTVGFRDSFWENNKEPNIAVFMRLSVSSAQCFIAKENPEAGINLTYADDKLSQGYDETVSCFRHLAEDKNVCSDIKES